MSVGLFNKVAAVTPEQELTNGVTSLARLFAANLGSVQDRLDHAQEQKGNAQPTNGV